jgi:CheY-like chemotaxis protein
MIGVKLGHTRKPSDRSSARTNMNDLHRLVILVVEDDSDARDLMQAVLEHRGARVFCAESVTRAFELLEGTQPDVIISDIAMPEEDGIGLVRRLRSLPADRGGQIPTIAVSAFSGSADRVRALAAGFDRYLHKPVDFDELASAIDSVRNVVEVDSKASA